MKTATFTKPASVVFTIEVMESMTGLYWRAQIIAGDDERGGECRRYLANEIREYRLYGQFRFPAAQRIALGNCPVVRLRRDTADTLNMREHRRARRANRIRRAWFAGTHALAVLTTLPVAILVAAIAAAGGALTALGLVDWTDGDSDHDNG